ncbi:peptidase M16 [Deinococcus grandis]|uniref:Peptidase M16 n=1 Tax=Deinococcus grandis TaxID=57498 RepID=A0A100HNV6_9DEIO|nr:peptidase M16 [Deinococcus grandis]
MPDLPHTQLHQHTLPNGLTLLLEPDPDAQTIAAGYFVNTGSREETPQDMGASHFIEHLLFKGSDEVGARELNERLDDLGGHANAFTSEEATVYHAATLPEYTPELLHTLTELMRPALRDDDIHTERGVILEEIAMYADQPSVRVTDQLRADYWGDHPLGQPILGTTDTVTNLTPDTLRAHHQARYGARRVTLAVTGQFDPHQLTTWAEHHLRDWPTGTPTPTPTPAPPPGPTTPAPLPTPTSPASTSPPPAPASAPTTPCAKPRTSSPTSSAAKTAPSTGPSSTPAPATAPTSPTSNTSTTAPSKAASPATPTAPPRR